MQRSTESAAPRGRVWREVVVGLVLTALAYLSCAVFSTDVFSNGLIFASLLFGLSFLAALCGAALLCYANLKKRVVLWAVGPLCGFGVAAAFGFSPMMIPMWLVLLVGAELSYHLVLKKTSRIPCAVALSALVTLCFAAQLLLFALWQGQAIDLSAFLEFLQTRAAAFAERTGNLLLENLGEEKLLATVKEFVGLLTSSLLLALPGLFLTAVFFLSYLSTVLLRLLMKQGGVLQILYPDGFYLRPSIVTAAMYATCLVFTSLFSAILPIQVYGAFTNLSSVLELIFAFTALSSFFRPRTERAFRLSPLMIASFAVFAVILISSLGGGAGLGVLVMGVVSVISVGLPVLSFIGLFQTVFAFFRDRRATPSDEEKGN